jgi:hypothetical protein
MSMPTAANMCGASLNFTPPSKSSRNAVSLLLRPPQVSVPDTLRPQTVLDIDQ